MTLSTQGFWIGSGIGSEIGLDYSKNSKIYQGTVNARHKRGGLGKNCNESHNNTQVLANMLANQKQAISSHLLIFVLSTVRPPGILFKELHKT